LDQFGNLSKNGTNGAISLQRTWNTAQNQASTAGYTLYCEQARNPRSWPTNLSLSSGWW